MNRVGVRNLFQGNLTFHFLSGRLHLPFDKFTPIKYSNHYFFHSLILIFFPFGMSVIVIFILSVKYILYPVCIHFLLSVFVILFTFNIIMSFIKKKKFVSLTHSFLSFLIFFQFHQLKYFLFFLLLFLHCSFYFLFHIY